MSDPKIRPCHCGNLYPSLHVEAPSSWSYVCWNKACGAVGPVRRSVAAARESWNRRKEPKDA